MKKVVSLVGARPQFIKEAVISRAVRETAAWKHVLVHSGQHYDFNMSGAFFEELGIPKPDYFMGVGSGSHAAQTADAMVRFEDILTKEKPDMALVYGDTNTTLAGALDAAKLHIPVAHVEAGPRTYNKLFPEEINRVLTDHVSDLLFACTRLNVDNLKREGLTKGVYNTGDVMYDLYKKMLPRFAGADILKGYGLEANKYVLVTIHRDFNTDGKERLESILKGIALISKELSLKAVLPMHPRLRKRADEFSLGQCLKDIKAIEPLGYTELMSLLQTAAFVITDSGGFQKESYWAHKRGLLVMPQGWDEITSAGWHRLIPDPARADWLREAEGILAPPPHCGDGIFGDGRAAEKIVKHIREYLAQGR